MTRLARLSFALSLSFIRRRTRAARVRERARRAIEAARVHVVGEGARAQRRACMYEVGMDCASHVIAGVIRFPCVMIGSHHHHPGGSAGRSHAMRGMRVVCCFACWDDRNPMDGRWRWEKMVGDEAGQQAALSSLAPPGPCTRAPPLLALCAQLRNLRNRAARMAHRPWRIHRTPTGKFLVIETEAPSRQPPNNATDRATRRRRHQTPGARARCISASGNMAGMCGGHAAISSRRQRKKITPPPLLQHTPREFALGVAFSSH